MLYFILLPCTRKICPLNEVTWYDTDYGFDSFVTSKCVGLEWQYDLISNIFTGQSLDRLHQIEIALEGLHSEKPHFWFDYSSSSNVTSGLLHLLPLNSSNKWIIAVNIDDHIFVSFGDGLAFCFLHSCLCLILVCSC